MNAILTTADLEVGYKGKPVLSEINLDAFAPGQMVGLLGPNAAGKSTLLKSLAGQIPYQGSIAYMGKELSSMSHADRSACIGYSPQTAPQPSSLLVYEFALGVLRTTMPHLSSDEVEHRIEMAFTRLGLMDIATRRVSELSGGKRQLLGLAQILARETDVILLDEPTSALDLRWQTEALSVVREVVRSRQAVAISALHDINLALRYCDHLILVGHGEVMAQGEASTTLSTDLLRQAYGVEARLETCSHGRIFVIVDGAQPMH